jgi:hypothetical protein
MHFWHDFAFRMDSAPQKSHPTSAIAPCRGRVRVNDAATQRRIGASIGKPGASVSSLIQNHSMDCAAAVRVR